MELTQLELLKINGEAPEWLDEVGYATLSNGYLGLNETPRAMYERISKSSASYQPNQDWKEYFNLFWNNWLCGATPILCNSGTDRGLNISCYGQNIQDSLDSIYQGYHETSILTKNGGGIGKNYSNVRGRGQSIKGNGVSNGIIPWLKTEDSSIISLSQGCYDNKTQLLTENGWEYFEDLKEKTKVYQSDIYGNVSLTNFSDFIKYAVDEDLFSISNKTKSVDLFVTHNHRMATEKLKKIDKKRVFQGSLDIKIASELKLHRDNRVWVASKNSQGNKKVLSFEDRFKIAYQADGSTIASKQNKYRFHFKKERKINRLKELLDNLGWKYNEVKDNNSGLNIYVNVPFDVKLSKNLFDIFNLSDFSKDYAIDFIHEVKYWDGSINKNTNKFSMTYSCVVIENIDFLQGVSFLAGYMSKTRIVKRDKTRKNLGVISINTRFSVGGEELNITKENYKGYVYCVTVPDGLLVVRRNGVVAICGNSSRRGSEAVYLDINHPDIEEFLEIRKTTGDINRRCLNLNHAVNINDEFMLSLENNYKNRLLWQKLLEMRFTTGQPYLMFTDNVNRNNPDCYKYHNLKVSHSNLCSEIMLYSSDDETFICCLSSMNLSKWEEWKNTNAVNLSIRFLDGQLSEFIEKGTGVKGLEKAVNFSIKHRALGLGALGLHSLFQSKNLSFESLQAKLLNTQIFKYIQSESKKASQELAKEFGEPYYCKGFGLRNTHTNAVAPTTSNALISSNVSQSIEPWASNVFVQKSAKGTFIRKNKQLQAILKNIDKDNLDIWNQINSNNGSVSELSFLSTEQKDVFKTAREINQHIIIKLASDRQKFIDQGQSLNLFFSENASPKYIHEVHYQAWKQDLKALYYLRSEGVLKGDSTNYKSIEECTYCES